jgi:GNAT superfamily N-acetyltransferase
MNPLHAPFSDSPATFALRDDLRPGDLGVLISLHGTVYARECGFDSTFEAHVAHHLGEFVQARTDSDRLWIAEWEGRVAGSIAIVSHSERDAQLCWLIVDPSARSMGLGRRLLHEAVAFCRRRGYDYVFLRSVQSLTAAAHLFRSIGFEKVEERPSERWGVATIEEWYVLHPFREEISRRQAAARGSGGTRG